MLFLIFQAEQRKSEIWLLRGSIIISCRALKKDLILILSWSFLIEKTVMKEFSFFLKCFENSSV